MGCDSRGQRIRATQLSPHAPKFNVLRGEKSNLPLFRVAPTIESRRSVIAKPFAPRPVMLASLGVDGFQAWLRYHDCKSHELP